MGYQVRMVPEVEQWLAGVREHDPAAADRIDQAVAALRAAGESLGPPLVVPVEDPPRPGVTAAQAHLARRRRPAPGAPRWLLARAAFPGLDVAYERQRARLTPVRRAVADVATSRKRLELQIGQLEQQAGAPDDPGAVERRLADLRRQYAGRQAEEERLALASQRLQAKVDAFRASQEACQAAYLAAEEAAATIWAELTEPAAPAPAATPENAAPQNTSPGGTSPGGTSPGGTSPGGTSPGGTSPAGTSPGGTSPGGTSPDGAPRSPSWLSELRPGAPESADVRILFTVEPPGTAVLLAAGMESDRMHAWYAEAIASCRFRYHRDRGGTRPHRGPRTP